MNYDTLEMLKNDNTKNDDIVNIFTHELEYPTDLTNNLINLDKSYLKSIIMRIKLKINKNHSNNDIKLDLLTYNKTIEPLLEKLLLSSLKKKPEILNTVKETVKTVVEEVESTVVEKVESTVVEEVESTVVEKVESTVVEKVESTVVEKVESTVVEEVESTVVEKVESTVVEKVDNKFLEEFLEDYFTKTGNNKDVLKISSIYDLLKEHCTVNSHPSFTKENLKEFLKEEWGIPKKDGYHGFKIIEEDDESDEEVW